MTPNGPGFESGLSFIAVTDAELEGAAASAAVPLPVVDGILELSCLVTGGLRDLTAGNGRPVAGTAPGLSPAETTQVIVMDSRIFNILFI